MLNEEEKKAIERIEDTFYQDLGKGINKFQKITLYEDRIADIRKLLNIVEKQQKDCISKDKIREKIKELEKQKEKLKYDGNRCFADYEQFCKNLKFFKEQIDELLEEN